MLANPHKLSPIYDPNPPTHTDSLLPSERKFHHSPKIVYSDVFQNLSRKGQCTEFLKSDSESLFRVESGHIFNFCLASS
jgi:hypothetical protein